MRDKKVTSNGALSSFNTFAALHKNLCALVVFLVIVIEFLVSGFFNGRPAKLGLLSLYVTTMNVVS